jgi:hypothetical protein
MMPEIGRYSLREKDFSDFLKDLAKNSVLPLSRRMIRKSKPIRIILCWDAYILPLKTNYEKPLDEFSSAVIKAAQSQNEPQPDRLQWVFCGRNQIRNLTGSV